MSGTTPSAGPKFSKSGTVWRVITPRVVLRNSVTDADGDTANLTFQVYTANADGTPKAQVDLDGSGEYGVLVSPYVASGATARVTVPYGILKPGVLYKFRTSAFDGSLYETNWSPWADFRIEPYVKFPAAQTSSTIDKTAQEIIEFTRTNPGPALPTFDANGAVKREATQKRTCGKQDAQGRTLCIELSPPTAESQARAIKRAEALRKAEEAKARKAGKSPAEAAEVAAVAPAVELVDWCWDKPAGKDYMSRGEACLKNIGSATLVFIDPDDVQIGTATFDIEQRIKAYPNKGASGSNFAEFDQQIAIMPVSIAPALEGVTMKWNIGSTCSSCVTSNVKWTDGQNNNAGPTAYWNVNDGPPYGDRWGRVTTQWNGSGKETIGLGWSVTATVDASSTAIATANFGTSGIDEVKELAPRCDNWVAGSAPGCVLPYFKPTWTLDTNKYPAAGGYYWYMQQVMPDHAGSKRWDSLMHYLGPDTPVKNGAGNPWNSNNSRDRVCDSTWSLHPSDTSVGTVDCDEYAMASTHESGGYPKSVNLVTSGSKCAQLFTDKMGDGSANFGLLADTRTATNGPSGTERCGRAAIPSVQNEQAFSGFPAPAWRLLDGDGFFVTLPGFEHCTSTATTCTWKKIG
ncbi:hypothetical protein [Streptomyces sp. AK08-02]|uniref:hypothetical protein n=1 Tax=Streptomyces sp. AK08-02 TaxID=3028654 RepID=UPI0029A28C46|nr:hypothetical protein [Streptomyces sp. AK08-02]MDX3746523.1 hypothetical protein [Streptomyces sp. AK08-02]